MSNVVRRKRTHFNSTYANPEDWLHDSLSGGRASESGVHINGRTALEYSPVWYALSTIGGQVGQLPLNVHKVVSDRENVVDYRHKAQRLVKEEPNELMAADVFREVLQGHAMLRGNGRAGIERNMRGDPLSLIPLQPDNTRTIVITNEQSGSSEKWHIVNYGKGEPLPINDADVIHIMGLTGDGLEGYDLVGTARGSIGLGLGSEQASARHFKNNGAPGLLLSAPKGMFETEEEAVEFLRNFKNMHSGIDNTSKVGLLRDGITATTLAANNRDAQWLEQRGFQRQEMMLWFCLEQIPGNNASVSYNSEEQKNLAFLQRCLNRWLVRWENELNRKLRTRQERESGSHYFKFNRNALLQATTKERYEVYNLAIPLRIMSPNECRAKEDLPPYKGGDNYENPHINPSKSLDGMSNRQKALLAFMCDSTDKIRRLIEARLKAIQKVETQRVIDAAASKKNFMDWLDKFYSAAEFAPKLAKVILECGGTEAEADGYTSQSRELLSAVAGKATADGFVAAVQEEVAKWGNRAEQLAAAISLNQQE